MKIPLSPEDIPQDATSTEIQAIVEASIRYYEQKALAFKTYHNTLAPISRLPSEILAHTFVLSRAYLNFCSRQEVMKTKKWIAVSQVCRHWRDTALQTPELWSLVAYKDTQSESRSIFQRLQIQRSKSHSLRIRAHINHTHSHSLGRIIEASSSRSELEISFSYKVDVQHQLDRLPMDQLKGLTIQTPNMHGNNAISLKGATELQSLTVMHCCLLDLSSTSLRGKIISQLVLEDIGPQSWTWTIFSDTMKTLASSLKILKLTNAVPAPPQGSNVEQVKLPYLTEFLISDEGPAVCFVLREALSIPVSTSLTIKNEGGWRESWKYFGPPLPDSKSQVKYLFASLAICRSSSTLVIRNLVWLMPKEGPHTTENVRLEARFALPTETSPQRNEYGSFNLRFHGPNKPNSSPYLPFVTFSDESDFPGLSLLELQKLTFTPNSGPMPKALLDFASHLEHLVDIRINDPGAFLHYLEEDSKALENMRAAEAESSIPSKFSSSTTTRCFAPLKVLAIVARSHSVALHPPFLKVLSRNLELRHIMGRPLQVLEFAYVKLEEFPGQKAEELARYVGRFVTAD